VRFDDRVTGKTDTFAAQAKIVHIDIDPTSIRKNVPVSIPVVGDCKSSLEARLNAYCSRRGSGRDWMPGGPPGWHKSNEWKSKLPLAYDQKEEDQTPVRGRKLYELTGGRPSSPPKWGRTRCGPPSTTISTDPNHFITSGGLGTMGFGLPAAIGAQVACPDALVVDVAGDGSIQMNIQEMATAVQYGLPVKVVILNNGYLGMVRQWQELFYDKRYACTCMDHAPDFVKLAEAYGAVGLRATRPDEVEGVLRQGIETRGPVIMDFRVARKSASIPWCRPEPPLRKCCWSRIRDRIK
jgi:acetolactate synthase-1/2/3 large subunit